MGWKAKRTGLFPGKELRIKGNKEQRSRENIDFLSLKASSAKRPEIPEKENE